MLSTKILKRNKDFLFGVGSANANCACNNTEGKRDETNNPTLRPRLALDLVGRSGCDVNVVRVRE
jgi:hypothetical protein